MDGIINVLRERGGEQVSVNSGGYRVVYIPTDSACAPYCGRCQNSLLVRIESEPINLFGDREVGYCDACNKQYPIRRIDIN